MREDRKRGVIVAAKAVCGETTKSVANPWTVGFEDEMEAMKENTVRAVRTRGEKLIVVNEMREMDEREEERVNAERELEDARRDVRECRRRMKRRLRELEREWWNDKIERCEEACEEG